MAGFTENLKVEIESIFNSAGFDKLQTELKQTQAQLASTFGQVKKMRRMRREANKFASVMERAGLGQRSGDGAPFFNLKGGSPVKAEEATQRMMRAMGEMEMISSGLSENVGNVNSHMQQAANAAVNTLGGVDSEGFADTLSTRRFKETTRSSNRLGRSFRRARSGAVRLGAGIGAVGSAMASAAPATRALQMRLLGLQFTMLTVAFIFGGLLASALGAVGVFEVLGNTLKFLFLPTALNVLGGVLGIQEAVMNMDEETRQLIGDIFLWISVFAIVIGLAAALGKAVLSIVGFITTLTSGLGTLIGFFSSADTAGKGLIGTLKAIGSSSSIVGGLKTIFAKIVGVASSVATTISSVVNSLFGFSGTIGTLGTLASFLGGLVAGFLSVLTVAQRFGKKVALVFGVILAVVAGVVAAIVSTPALVIAAVGVMVGAILGIIWTFRDAFISIIMGLVNIVIQFFVGIFNFVKRIILGVVNIIQGLVTAVVALFLGKWGKLKKGLGEIFKGIKQLIIGPLKAVWDFVVNDLLGGFIEFGQGVWDFLVGNSIFPDLIHSIMGLFGDLLKFIAGLPLKIAKMALEIGKGFVNAIAKGISAVGDIIWDSLKSFLPKPVIDALEAAGGFIKGGIDVAGDLAGGALDAAGNLAGGAADAVGGLFGGGGNNNTQNQTNVQQNNINADVQVNDKEETPQETGQQLGKGIKDGINQRSNNTASGF